MAISHLLLGGWWSKKKITRKIYDFCNDLRWLYIQIKHPFSHDKHPWCLNILIVNPLQIIIVIIFL
jgi:hypothetical protein